ncbi:MAG: pantetheine-phosphate adenylyltransferase [Candidatus Moranbacteria bacterium]|nr:pantetheine-phosphate adenylyltransferase [Candidatus Moranbacteria bacterium]MBP9801360.1 pantetheine-phosphate adenylyltransferase [Candidatus Moranbacteria bacterium]
MKRYRRGLVALSADPITFGHIDLIRRAKDLCDSLVILVANNDLKVGSYLFTLEERVAITKEAVQQAGIANIYVIGSQNLLVDVYIREDCDIVFRGIRNEKDAAFEKEQMELHVHILPDLQGRIEFLESHEEYRMISSSLVKAFVRSHVDVSRFVPAFVKQLLEERICQQYILAVTGCQANGKTYVAESLARNLVESGIESHVISIDVLLRTLYDEDSLGAQKIRLALSQLFGDDVLTADQKQVRRSVLKKRIFDSEQDTEKRELLHSLVEPHIDRLYREALAGKKGLIIFEWAQLAEMKMSFWSNHQVIVVTSDDQRLLAEMREISSENQSQMANFQWSTEEKIRALYQAANEAMHGTVVSYTNRVGDEESMNRLAQTVRKIFPALGMV